MIRISVVAIFVFLIFINEAVAKSCAAPIFVINESESSISIRLKSFYPNTSTEAPPKNSFEDEMYEENNLFFTQARTIEVEPNSSKEIAFRFLCGQIWVNYKVSNSQVSGQLDWRKKENTIVFPK